MTERQRRFADEYIIDLNATRAYLEAYTNVKNENTAAAAASRMLRNVKVEKYIADRLAEIKSQKIAEAKEVEEYLTAVMRGEEVGERLRLRAAEMLAKRYGMFNEKFKADNLPPPIIIDDIGES